MARPRPRRSAIAGLVAVVSMLATLAAPPSSFAAEPSIEIEPEGPFPVADRTVTVSGSGFDPAANGGVGLYVVFGPRTIAPTYYTDASLYGAARWVHPGAGESPGQARLEADGTFVTTLDIQPRYVDGHGTAIDCLVSECVVITMVAHGVPDRSYDTFTHVSFAVDETVPPVTPLTGDGGAGGQPPVLLLGAGVVAILALVGLAIALGARRRPRGSGARVRP